MATMRRREKDGFSVSTDPALLDVAFVHRSLQGTHWGVGRTRACVEESIRNSVCFGLYDAEGRQVGFSRLVTDHCTFTWVCDVFVDETHRRKGLGQWLMACVAEHPCVKELTAMLATRDAHGLYEKFGFTRHEMMRKARPPGISPPPERAIPPG